MRALVILCLLFCASSLRLQHPKRRWHILEASSSSSRISSAMSSNRASSSSSRRSSRSGSSSSSSSSSRLYARASRVEDGKQAQGNSRPDEGSDDDKMTLPYAGLVGKEQGGLFDKPLAVFDPVKNVDDLPGADGSAEKIEAIQRRIQERVEELKKAGEWGDEGDAFGRDPLAKQPIWTTMAMQIKSCRPFESFDELALTYVLMITTSVLLSTYLLFLRDSFDVAIVWFNNTDFDSDFLPSLFQAVQSGLSSSSSS